MKIKGYEIIYKSDVKDTKTVNSLIDTLVRYAPSCPDEILNCSSCDIVASAYIKAKVIEIYTWDECPYTKY